MSWGSLLAQAELPTRQEMVDALRQSVSAGPASYQLYTIILGVVVVAVLLLLLSQYDGGRRKKRRAQKKDYLLLAVDVLGLSEKTRRELALVGRRAGLEEPLAMLLTPMNLARATAAAVQAGAAPRVHASMDALCRQLFDAPLPPVQ